MPPSDLPPPYLPVTLPATQSALAAACAGVAESVAEGTLYWADRTDRLDAALVLTPDRPRRALLPVLYVAALGAGDALGGLLPPTVPVTFAWPERIEVDGEALGRIALVLPDTAGDAVPHWLVLGLELDVAGVAAMVGEGLEAALLLAGFARHFLVWLDAWEDGAWPRVRDAWLARCLDAAERRAAALPGGLRGVPMALDEEGGLVALVEGELRTSDLDAALRAAAGPR
jgi:biotin-(acetyl-CoA carboxylase) ligase